MLWFIIGILSGAVVCWLILGTRSGKFKVRWYQWLLGVLAVLFLISAVQNYLGFQAGLEPHAASYALMLHGGIALIFAILLFVIPLIAGKVRKKETTLRA